MIALYSFIILIISDGATDIPEIVKIIKTMQKNEICVRICNENIRK